MPLPCSSPLPPSSSSTPLPLHPPLIARAQHRCSEHAPRCCCCCSFFLRDAVLFSRCAAVRHTADATDTPHTHRGRERAHTRTHKEMHTANTLTSMQYDGGRRVQPTSDTVSGGPRAVQREPSHGAPCAAAAAAHPTNDSAKDEITTQHKQSSHCNLRNVMSARSSASRSFGVAARRRGCHCSASLLSVCTGRLLCTPGRHDAAPRNTRAGERVAMVQRATNESHRIVCTAPIAASPWL